MAELEFCLLGPLMVRCGGAVIAVPRGNQRAVLATMLLSANQIVLVDELADVLWGAELPISARVTVQNYVKRLRQALGVAGRDRIITWPRGYSMSVKDDELDVSRFRVLVQSARAAARGRSWKRAAADAREALSLWRGEPLADVESELLRQREVPWLTEMRLQALEIRLNADLQLGGQADMIDELRLLVRVHPLRESLHGLLMLALSRCGRQAEALSAYRDARQMLVEELGSDPGTELQDLHMRILAADPTLASAEHAAPTPQTPVPAVPRELPAAVRHFIGRERELAMLTGLLDRASRDSPGTVVISAIGGTAGVGKTALAVQWAHRVAHLFPDGRLYVNLRGYDPDQPVATGDALAGFLRALGVPGQDIPAEIEERAARYRSLLAGRRVLIVLDNARSAEQIRLLLPGEPGCATVVTSRDALSGLVARDAAVRLELDLLPLAEAVGLLRELIGPRVDADPIAAAALADQCSRLPLALRVAAEFAAARPGTPLADLVRELADQSRRLDLLDAGGDQSTAVRAVFSWSYRHLDAGSARAFRLAAMHPGSDFDAHSIAALVGTTAKQAEHALGILARTHLIQPARSSRYGMHDLLRAYARELADAHDGELAQREATTRLFRYYQHSAAAAVRLIFPPRRRWPSAVPPTVPDPRIIDEDTARAWLDTERSCLVAVMVYMTEHGWPHEVPRLASTLSPYLEHGGHIAEATTVQRHALRASRLAGDRLGEANALTDLGVIDLWQGRYQRSISLLQQALALFWEIGDRFGAATASSHLAVIERRHGRCQQAADHQQQALSLFRQIGDEWGQAAALNRLGVIELEQCHYQQAIEYQQQSITLSRQIGDRIGEAEALMRLGVIKLRQCHYQQAADHQQQAIALFRQIGARISEADALENLGDVFLAIDRPGDARSRYAAALRLAQQTGDANLQARAHHGLAHVWRALGDPAQAQHHWQEALAIYSQLGAPEAAQVRDELSMSSVPVDTR